MEFEEVIDEKIIDEELISYACELQSINPEIIQENIQEYIQDEITKMQKYINKINASFDPFFKNGCENIDQIIKQHQPKN